MSRTQAHEDNPVRRENKAVKFLVVFTVVYASSAAAKYFGCVVEPTQ